MKTDEQARQLLKDFHLRVTPTRISLLVALLKSRRPMSLDSAAEACGWQAGDRATVFRNLQALAEAGVVRVVRSAGRREVYEISSGATKQVKHAHVVCTECGRVECVDGAEQSGKAASVEGWKVTGQEVTLWGLCPTCG
ncbi:MAG: transcriptional repressor [Planctomycetes bacterium]|nr:transcriptional repressor [Planctomycetota bacterium]